MKKILHITSSLDRNGTETFIMNVYRRIDRTEIQFDFLLFSQNTEGYYNEALSLGAQIYRLPTRREGFTKYYNELNVFFKKHASEYQGIHFCSCSLTTILPVYFAKRYGIPIRIVHAHNSSWSGIHNLILHKINRWFLPQIANQYIACSGCAAQWFFRPSLLKRTIILKNGIDTDKFAFNTSLRIEYREQMSWNNRFVIGHVGRFVTEKNQSFLIKLVDELRIRIPNVLLVLVGYGEQKDTVCEEVKARGLEKYAIFLGLRNDVDKLFQAFDCFVLPSLFEGLPFVLVEAQCSGLKVLTSTVVSQEAKLTANIDYLDLNAEKADWINKICSYEHYERKDMSPILVSEGYSIDDTVKTLSNIYLK